MDASSCAARRFSSRFTCPTRLQDASRRKATPMPFAPLILLAVAAAQAAAPARSQCRVHGRGGRPFISPMGEPFRARPRRRHARRLVQPGRPQPRRLSDRRRDASRRPALLRDARHQSRWRDRSRRDHPLRDRGRARNPAANRMRCWAPAKPDGNRAVGGGGRSADGGGHGTRRVAQHRPRRGAPMAHQGAGRYGLLDLPEPVVAADADFNRGISLDEFRQAAVAALCRCSTSTIAAARPCRARGDPARAGAALQAATRRRHRHAVRRGRSYPASGQFTLDNRRGHATLETV